MTNILTMDAFTPFIHLIYAGLPDDIQLTKHWHGILADSYPQLKPDAIQVEWYETPSPVTAGAITFGDHRVRFFTASTPLPGPIIDRTIHVAPLPPQVRAYLRQHQAHLSLVYTGTHSDPLEQMIALYTAASLFQNTALAGVVNEQAWTAHPVGSTLSPATIASFRENLPWDLWVGRVKFYQDATHYWLVTRGQHIFDVPDLAAWIETESIEQQWIAYFFRIFHYLRSDQSVALAGDTLEMSPSGEVLRFSAVPAELTEQLQGPSGTLALAFDHSQDPTAQSSPN